MICGQERHTDLKPAFVWCHHRETTIYKGIGRPSLPQSDCEEFRERNTGFGENRSLGHGTPIYGGLMPRGPWLERSFLPKKSLFSTEKRKLSTEICGKQDHLSLLIEVKD